MSISSFAPRDPLLCRGFCGSTRNFAIVLLRALVYLVPPRRAVALNSGEDAGLHWCS